MGETMFFLTDPQVQRLKQVLAQVEGSDRPPVTNSRRPRKSAARALIGLLTDSVAATTGLATKPKVGTLNIYTFSSTGVEDTGIDATVYNFAPQAATTDRWTVVERCSATGKLIITSQFCT